MQRKDRGEVGGVQLLPLYNDASSTGRKVEEVDSRSGDLTIINIY